MAERQGSAWRAVSRPPDAKHATVATDPRSRGDIGPYRSVNRDRTIEATNAPPGSRQTWQLHRAREESRDLELRSAVWRSYNYFSRIQTVGYELSRLQFDRLTKEQAARLPEVIRHLRREWRRFQKIPTVGGRGQTIHQMAGQVLHHVNVDGDCFVTNRTVLGRRVWDLHPGDALAEHMRHIAPGGGNEIQLGVESDSYGKPVAYLFGHGGKITPLNWSYGGYGSAGTDVRRVAAGRVLHVRDMSGESTVVRGWPLCTPVIGLIARVDEWLEALARSAVLRAAVGLAMETQPDYVAPPDRTGRGFGDVVKSLGSTPSDGLAGSAESERLRPYQKFAAEGGGFLELPPGFTLKKIDTGSPTSQEVAGIVTVLQLIAGALRATPATLYGDYKSLSFSGGQLAHMQERQAIEDRQMILCNQFFTPIFADWLRGRWMNVVREFPEIEPMEDFDTLLYPTIVLRKYAILDKGRLVKPIMEAFSQGLMDYSECRAELGYSGVDGEQTIEQWKEDRKALGLPESPTQANGGKVPGESDDDDDDDDDSDEEGDGKDSKDDDDGAD